MQIYVNFFLENLILNAESSDIVENLKSKIQEQKGIPIEQQRLFFAHIQLEDCHTLDHYNIREAATLLLILKPRDGVLMTIVVAGQNNHYEICINSSETILYLKQLYYNLSGLHIRFQRLFFGKSALQSNRTLESYGIGPGAILHLLRLKLSC